MKTKKEHTDKKIKVETADSAGKEIISEHDELTEL